MDMSNHDHHMHHMNKMDMTTTMDMGGMDMGNMTDGMDMGMGMDMAVSYNRRNYLFFTINRGLCLEMFKILHLYFIGVMYFQFILFAKKVFLNLNDSYFASVNAKRGGNGILFIYHKVRLAL